MSRVQEEILKLDVDIDYRISLIRDGQEPPPLFNLPEMLKVDTNAPFYNPEEDPSIIVDSVVPSILHNPFRLPKSVAEHHLTKLEEVVRGLPPPKPNPDPPPDDDLISLDIIPEMEFTTTFGVPVVIQEAASDETNELPEIEILKPVYPGTVYPNTSVSCDPLHCRNRSNILTDNDTKQGYWSKARLQNCYGIFRV